MRCRCLGHGGQPKLEKHQEAAYAGADHCSVKMEFKRQVGFDTCATCPTSTHSIIPPRP